MADLAAGTSEEAAATQPDEITVNVKTLQPNTYTLRVSKEITVLELKEKLESLSGIPPERQRVIYRGRMLVNESTLGAAGVEDGHSLHLVERPADAPPPQATDPVAPGSGGTHEAPRPPQAAGAGAPGLNEVFQQILGSLGTAAAAGDAATGSPQSAAAPTVSVQHQLAVGTVELPLDLGSGGQLPDMNQLISQVLSSMQTQLGPQAPGAAHPPSLQPEQAPPPGGEQPQPQPAARQEPPRSALAPASSQPRRQHPGGTAAGGRPFMLLPPHVATNSGDNRPVMLRAGIERRSHTLYADLANFLNALIDGPQAEAESGDAAPANRWPVPTSRSPVNHVVPPNDVSWDLVMRLFQSARTILETRRSTEPHIQEALRDLPHPPTSESAQGSQDRPYDSLYSPAATAVLSAAFGAILERFTSFLSNTAVPDLRERSEAILRPMRSRADLQVLDLADLCAELSSIGYFMLDLGRLALILHHYSEGVGTPIAVSSPRHLPPQYSGNGPRVQHGRRLHVHLGDQHGGAQAAAGARAGARGRAGARPGAGAVPQQRASLGADRAAIQRRVSHVLSQILPNIISQTCALVLDSLYADGVRFDVSGAQQPQPNEQQQQQPPPPPQEQQLDPSRPPVPDPRVVQQSVQEGMAIAAAVSSAAEPSMLFPDQEQALGAADGSPAAAAAASDPVEGAGGCSQSGADGSAASVPTATGVAAEVAPQVIHSQGTRVAALSPPSVTPSPQEAPQPRETPSSGRGLGGLGLPSRGRGSGRRTASQGRGQAAERAPPPPASAPAGGASGGGALADGLMALLNGPAGESLMAAASRLAEDPAVSEAAERLTASESGEGEQPPDLGRLLSQMMPAVQGALTRGAGQGDAPVQQQQQQGSEPEGRAGGQQPPGPATSGPPDLGQMMSMMMPAVQSALQGAAGTGQPAAASAGGPPGGDLSQIMSSMMPMVQSMLGGGVGPRGTQPRGGARGEHPPASVVDDDAWRECLSADDLAVIDADVAEMERARGRLPAEELSEAYRSGMPDNNGRSGPLLG